MFAKFLSKSKSCYVDKVVPYQFTVDLILKQIKKQGLGKVYLVDGFPRTLANLDGWELTMKKRAAENQMYADVKQVIFFDLPEETMIERITKRHESEEQAKTEIETAQQKLINFNDTMLSVIKYYETKDMVYRVNASKTTDDIFEDLKKNITV